ncbi:ABC-type antimicrobial peptide transport system permease subunit [Dyadobacter sp. BE34]|uniref:ABC-type antimicrobial peptide transport system permease subunit n=1 Tax=Dyadobacter fermentans TaxID=94254 RepID=A0ABU1QRP4_9BACT|nr:MULTISPECIES: ABC transporter permease [Dyadobacter]MDR6803839.1 ABC-type antimicrobial peptide transport system permease subunit [Dyadobacter fermentans]MDR7041579.1 ABC-type antimicrobial peptide transport system permease subunit [Dyadobacter sp. BE242]MDR7195982.1 ABC-type antimicrobial peptide transport system permease subunit [Dyadobacter sp. BE34]MDR7213473.1 ABC-type antimicrobial peptide transport system permease subunit [Dyadobacter sp. BE31]MDR7261388.1 ABC-type antimicrobial pept
MIKNYLVIALRNLLKNKVYSLINIVGLAVGIAVTMLIGLWVWDELSFNKYHKNYDRVVQAWISQTFNGQTGTGTAVSIPSVTEMATKYSADFKHTALASWNFGHLLANGDKKINKTGMWAQPSLPEMLGLKMIRGDYDALKNPGSIVICESLAKALFGNADPLNKALKLDIKKDVKVTGVYEDIPFNSSFNELYLILPWNDYLQAEGWIKDAQTQWGNHSFQWFAQVADHADIATVSRKIRDVEMPHAFSKTDKPQYMLHPMSRWHLYSDFKDGQNIGGRIQFVWLFGIIGAFVLLLACINFMNLSTARSEKRAKEVGIRKSIGSLKSQLVFQFLSESFLVVMFALVLAILIVLVSLPAFNDLAGKHVKFPFFYWQFWLLLIFFALFTGLVAGSYPAFYLSSFNPLSVLKGTFKVGKYSGVPRKVMVVLQFTVSITLIIGTIIVFQQIQHAKDRPVGYDRQGLLQINISPNLWGKYDPLRNDLLKTGSVYEMSESSSPTTGIYSNQIGFEWEGLEPGSVPLFGTIACTHDFGKTIGWKIIDGRDFSREFSTDSSGFILNESAVKLTGLKNIVGKTIRYNGKEQQVVGVIKDMVMQSPYEPAVPTIFMLKYDWANLINVKLTPGAPVDKALKKVEAVFRKHDPDSPFEFKFADEEYDAKFRAEERIGKLSRVFAVLAVFISCLGLFGLAAYTAEQRTKEIGIRKALGASVAQMWAMLSKEFVYLVVISCVIASPIALYFLHDWLDKYEYHIQLSWVVFVVAALLAVAITLLTVSFQAIKAALMNPVKSLRSE